MGRKALLPVGKNSHPLSEEDLSQGRRWLTGFSSERKRFIWCTVIPNRQKRMQTDLCEILSLEEIPGYEHCYGCESWKKESKIRTMKRREKLIAV